MIVRHIFNVVARGGDIQFGVRDDGSAWFNFTANSNWPGSEAPKKYEVGTYTDGEADRLAALVGEPGNGQQIRDAVALLRKGQ